MNTKDVEEYQRLQTARLSPKDTLDSLYKAADALAEERQSKGCSKPECTCGRYDSPSTAQYLETYP